VIRPDHLHAVDMLQTKWCELLSNSKTQSRQLLLIS